MPLLLVGLRQSLDETPLLPRRGPHSRAPLVPSQTTLEDLLSRPLWLANSSAPACPVLWLGQGIRKQASPCPHQARLSAAILLSKSEIARASALSLRQCHEDFKGADRLGKGSPRYPLPPLAHFPLFRP